MICTLNLFIKSSKAELPSIMTLMVKHKGYVFIHILHDPLALCWI